MLSRGQPAFSALTILFQIPYLVTDNFLLITVGPRAIIQRMNVIIRRETRAYSGGDGIVDLLVGFPVPGQEFMEA
ncbi:hypothetical protein CDI09_17185, partial [Komagataeibacter nataicola]